MGDYLNRARLAGVAWPTELDDAALERALYSPRPPVPSELCNFLLQENANDLDPSTFEHWCEQLKSLAANTRRSRQLIVRKLCLYRQRSEPGCFVPDPLYFARPQPCRKPALIEPAQIARMLAQTEALTPSANSPLRGAVLRLAIVLFYTAGLRRGEVLRLTLDDVDDQRGIIRVRESKFHKSRLVPLSTIARSELRRYLRQRLTIGDTRSNAPLLCNRSRGWRPYTGTGLNQGIGLLFDQADVRGVHGRRPRVHDLRHYLPSLTMSRTASAL